MNLSSLIFIFHLEDLELKKYSRGGSEEVSREMKVIATGREVVILVILLFCYQRATDSCVEDLQL